jgi:hypothetical protein
VTATTHCPRHCSTCTCPPELLPVDTTAPAYALVIAIDRLLYDRPRSSNP